MPAALRPLHQVRILSLALNLPGPAALMRCRRMGATCVKLEPPTGDPMARYEPAAYAELHEGIKVVQADLKTPDGEAVVHRELARTDVLLTSFRPSALKKLGLDWVTLHTRFPALCQVAIVGGSGDQAELPGHDLTYLAEHDLVSGTALPATLFADMAGSLMASEAVLQAALLQAERYTGTGDNHPVGRYIEVALSDAAAYLALPRHWGLTRPAGAVGGAHAGYRVYPCQDGRVAVAALEPHFAAALCAAAGRPGADAATMREPATHAALAAFFAGKRRAELDRLATEQDIPLHTLD
ncbi:MAG TPA: CoA transferase [Ramlibacter sp.]|jgi:crotonobetainyl-CoA:carnitine CoA-transferase CaiB-like acyl-CoA transferase|uniref:CoA transferase n=1 Tax=Ramlibacter sp. TaxID=1917967 RepID=UPI002D67BBDD|nr:CoA transferase [Ramlibacter sp.]HZY18415.1 CoA transferase [Ramlibacter sp.]